MATRVLLRVVGSERLVASPFPKVPFDFAGASHRVTRPVVWTAAFSSVFIATWNTHTHIHRGDSLRIFLVQGLILVKFIVQVQWSEWPSSQTNPSTLVRVSLALVGMGNTNAGVHVCWIITWVNKAPKLKARQKICMFATGKWSGLMSTCSDSCCQGILMMHIIHYIIGCCSSLADLQKANVWISGCKCATKRD